MTAREYVLERLGITSGEQFDALYPSGIVPDEDLAKLVADLAKSLGYVSEVEVDNAYLNGHDQGYDEGYEEGFADCLERAKQEVDPND